MSASCCKPNDRKTGICDHGHVAERVKVDMTDRLIAESLASPVPACQRPPIRFRSAHPGEWTEERAPACCRLCPPGKVLQRYLQHPEPERVASGSEAVTLPAPAKRSKTTKKKGRRR